MKRSQVVSVSLVVSLVLAFIPNARAQVVKQGKPGDSQDPAAFRSPMVIETVFAAANRTLWNQSSDWFEVPEYKELGKYSCEGIAFHGNLSKDGNDWDSGLSMRVRPRPENRAEVTIRIRLLNPRHNHDKTVTMQLEVMNGTDVVATRKMGPLDVEDKGHAFTSETTMTLPLDILKSDPITKLRITMTAEDD
jgi:hypothetical protein